MNILNTDFSKVSSLKIGGMGNMVFVREKSDLIEIISFARKNNLQIVTIGEGTNSYFGEDLSRYIFIKWENKSISYADVGDNILVNVSSSVIFEELIKDVLSKGFSGLENLSYIPGTAGAFPVQNVGAYGVEIKDILDSVYVYDLKSDSFLKLLPEDCNFSYRDSIFKQEKNRYIICDITLRLNKIFKPILTYAPLNKLVENKNLTALDVRNLVIETRKSKLPDYKLNPNCGSFFKNVVVGHTFGENLKNKYPELSLISDGDNYKIPTASIIEHIAEMKGFRSGNFGTWPTQPLAIVNYGNGNVDELHSFIKGIKDKVKDRSGIELETEVNYFS